MTAICILNTDRLKKLDFQYLSVRRLQNSSYAQIANPVNTVKLKLNQSLLEEQYFPMHYNIKTLKHKIMPAIKFINRLKTIDKLIHLETTGSPHQLADKINIKERQMYHYINSLKDLGAKIKFSRSKNSYVYMSDCKLVLTYEQN